MLHCISADSYSCYVFLGICKVKKITGKIRKENNDVIHFQLIIQMHISGAGLLVVILKIVSNNV